MNTLLPDPGTSADIGLDWPTWIVAGGFGLFCLLGIYATVLLLAGRHLPAQLRFLQLASLRGRLLLGFILVATLPAISLALVLFERMTHERPETTSTMLTSGVALAWLAGALLISICLALALVHSLSDPLEMLDKSVRDFDLDMTQPLPKPPPDTPPEVLAIFEHLGSLDERLRATYQQLRKSVKQGEKLRGELIYVIANREKAVEQRTEELQQANATLERLSREDSLTGLANRRRFAEFLARAWQRALRDKTPLCILIIDIDNFKAYNDNYGHQQGDQCLKLVAEAIRRAVGRASDLVSRYGGEEFVVVLGDTPLEGGLKIAENIRAAVERLGIAHKGARRHACVTVSIGVTSTLPTRDTQPETVLVAADRAMFNAKNDGKNKVAYSTAARTGTYQALCVSGDAGKQFS